jgi:hypothetical protein
VLTRVDIAGAGRYALKKDLLPFCYSLLTNSCLEVLDVSGNRCGNSLALCLSKVLQTNTTLLQVYWDDNRISGSGFLMLKTGLERNRTVRFIQPSAVDIATCLRSDKSTDVANLVQVIQEVSHIASNLIFPKAHL